MDTAEIANLLDDDGRVRRWPKKQDQKRLVLEYLSGKFTVGVEYSEGEANAVSLAGGKGGGGDDDERGNQPDGESQDEDMEGSPEEAFPPFSGRRFPAWRFHRSDMIRASRGVLETNGTPVFFPSAAWVPSSKPV